MVVWDCLRLCLFRNFLLKSSHCTEKLFSQYIDCVWKHHTPYTLQLKQLCSSLTCSFCLEDESACMSSVNMHLWCNMVRERAHICRPMSQDNAYKWSDMSNRIVLFLWASTITIQLRVLFYHKADVDIKYGFFVIHMHLHVRKIACITYQINCNLNSYIKVPTFIFLFFYVF